MLCSVGAVGLSCISGVARVFLLVWGFAVSAVIQMDKRRVERLAGWIERLRFRLRFSFRLDARVSFEDRPLPQV